ncbi:MAG: M24 family metallopeptidase [Chloroflexota bacterium]
MQSPDLERWGRVRATLAGDNLAALVCRLPENVVMLAGCWPVMGRTVVVFPAEGDPILLSPVSEGPAVERGWVGDVRTFRAWRVGDGDPEASIASLLRQALADRGLQGKRIGCEGSFGDIAVIQRALEAWGGVHSAMGRYADAGDGAEWVDCGPQLVELSGRKTEREIARVRVANEVADFGLEAFLRETVPGRRESEIAAAVESAIRIRGVGYKGVGNARGEAEVISGPRTGDAWDFPTSSDRVVEEGDLVVIELAAVADGYWSDLTRTVVAGSANDEQLRLFAAQRAAFQAAFQAMKPGAFAREVDAIARDALEPFGLRELFAHHTGHGIGFRYHEPIPFVHPDSTGILQEGMITSLEPGVYGADFGVRIEDNVVITPLGAESLCHTVRWPQLEAEQP